MKEDTKASIGFAAVLGTLLLFGLSAWQWQSHTAQAQDTQEIKPYVFAQLPHGRIYKTVHEGCELFITETESHWDMAYRDTQTTYSYAVATGRGCK
jgi:hypothetical protein